MLYDCFAFFNELDVLEIRLNTLDAIVDRFLIVEASKTFSGQPKSFIFEANSERFSKFLPKITYLKIDFPDSINTPWGRDYYQKDQLAQELASLHEDDWVLMSDLDEIPTPSSVMAAEKDDVITIFEQRLFHYFLNNESYKRWCGPVLLQYKNFKELGSIKKVRAISSKYEALRHNRKFPYFIKTAAEALGLKYLHHFRIVLSKDSGWHFSFIGGAKKVSEKLHAYAHTESMNLADDEQKTESLIRTGINLATSEKEFHRVEIDDSFPSYLRNHQEKFKGFILGSDTSN